MITVKHVHARTDLEEVFKIRRKVFVEEQGVPADLEYDEHDDEGAAHYLAEMDGKPVGAARWRETEKGFKLERFAVLKEFRGKGIGVELVKNVLNDIPVSDKEIYLNSQLKAVEFYERLGFHKVGNIFVEAGIEHFQMQLKR
ncbi:GNAT family N-acetyltransferase [Solitalea lacus]|uniref:GNAT family N-acetyltransferase n=1 Tax=Solitalea lacus TaxID=2911172 RepID=UPI001EDB7803|nr:GNAT family N-acetyltransferase [Solitalea lacus]UKJ06425.1 GNAT family N-acetyltransferase [Solitalea lacus]